eukprot:9079204-Lingulodinium_polyedra.AAC.1
MITQREVKSSKIEDDVVWRWLPCDDWVMRERAVGRIKPSDDGNVAFEEALQKRTTIKKKVVGVRCIKVFCGSEVRDGEKRE